MTEHSHCKNVCYDAELLKKAVERAYEMDSVPYLMGYLSSRLSLDGEKWLIELQKRKNK